MTSMSGDVPNERWRDDLEADQLDDLAAREDRDEGSDLLEVPPASRQHDIGASAAVPENHVSNERWENDLAAEQLDGLAADEGADETGGVP